MSNIPMRAKGAIDRNSLLSVNNQRIQGAFSSGNIGTLNTRPLSGGTAAPPHSATTAAPGRTTSPGRTISPQTASPAPARPAGAPVSSGPLFSSGSGLSRQVIPPLTHPAQKGQKLLLGTTGSLQKIRVCLGWNANDPRCDVDVSAFLLGDNGKVPGDSWFVFYGQTESPDGSTVFAADGGADREFIRIDLARLDPSVQRIVFVLTINEAFEKRLNFGMMQDAYLRILKEDDRSELVSFQLTDYYSNVISMMIGEIYRHSGSWKFNAVGNGLAKDLAGLCEWYGVQVV